MKRRLPSVELHVPLTVNAFNAVVPVGTAVRYYSVIGQPENVSTRTRTEAWRLPSGEPVVMVEGLSGAVALRALGW